jgi:acyl-CoA reductase-like NAD-dependent aldehyde dehydrogenase
MTEFTLIPASGTALPASPFLARHLIDGNWQDSTDGAVTERLSPSHGIVASRAARGGKAEAEAAIAAARAAFDDGRWSRLSGKARATVLLKVADLIEANVDRMALLETLESGKPITQARGEIGGAADLWRYSASLARTLHGDSHNSLGNDMLAVVLKEPIGVVSIITPWNFPFWILSQKLPFALAAGCTCVVKPSELTPSTTVILGELLIEAGLPAGVVNIVLGHGQPVGATLASDPRVDMVTFTGSTAVGRGIAAAASGTLKKVALELGGKNPQVIFPDADLESAADAVVFGVYFNVGQCCNSGSRIIVHEHIAEAFTTRVVELSKQVAFGDPLDPATQVGAIVTPEHGAKIDGYVVAAKAAGATVALGGAQLQVPGLGPQFYQPTVVTNVTPDMAIARDEVFGPVLTVLTFRTLDEALALVNDADYGLSAGVWSENVHTCLAFARGAQAGTVWTNTWMDGFP